MMRLWLAANNKTQAELAKELGINESTMSRFLSGKDLPYATTFIKIQTWAFGMEGPITSIDPLPAEVAQTLRDEVWSKKHCPTIVPLPDKDGR